MEPQNHVKLGSLLAEIGRQAQLTEEEFAVFENIRERNPVQSPDMGHS